MTFGIKKVRINTVATIREPDGWWIVKRVLDDASGLVVDSRIEGPYPTEGPAEQRASTLAMAIGEEVREAKRERTRKYSRDNRGHKPGKVPAKTMAAMVRFMQRVEE